MAKINRDTELEITNDLSAKKLIDKSGVSDWWLIYAGLKVEQKEVIDNEFSANVEFAIRDYFSVESHGGKLPQDQIFIQAKSLQEKITEETKSLGEIGKKIESFLHEFIDNIAVEQAQERARLDYYLFKNVGKD